MALMECAEVLKKRKQFDEALATLDNARMRLTRLAGDEPDDVQWLQLKYTRALILLEAGRHAEAVTAAEEALEAASSFRCRDVETGCFGILALGYARLRAVRRDGALAGIVPGDGRHLRRSLQSPHRLAQLRPRAGRRRSV